MKSVCSKANGRIGRGQGKECSPVCLLAYVPRLCAPFVASRKIAGQTCEQGIFFGLGFVFAPRCTGRAVLISGQTARTDLNLTSLFRNRIFDYFYQLFGHHIIFRNVAVRSEPLRFLSCVLVV